MTAKLIYIPGSPFARKVRIVLSELQVPHEAVISASYPPTPESLGQDNPTLRVPVFIDGDLALFESDLIVEYLCRSHGASATGDPAFLAMAARSDAEEWIDRKRSAAIASLTDTLVLLSYLAWCGMAETEENLMGFGLRARWHDRVSSTLDWLESEATSEGFIPGVLSVQDIALVCALDWTDRRLPFPWRGRPNLEAVVARFADRASFADTQFARMAAHLAPAKPRF